MTTVRGTERMSAMKSVRVMYRTTATAVPDANVTVTAAIGSAATVIDRRWMEREQLAFLDGTAPGRIPMAAVGESGRFANS